MRLASLLLAALLCGCHAPAAPQADATAEVEVERALDDLHLAAARADSAAYFTLFAPDAVFLGTDARERWTIQQFRAYAEPHFAAGRGWTYVPTERHVALSPDQATAWFDERLENAKYGECRGTGVLRRLGGAWRIVQYNLSVPVPNELLGEVAQRIRLLGHD